MSSGQAVHVEAFNKLSSISSALNAVLECHKVLSNTRMEEEDRRRFINKLFEILGEVKESMFQHSLEGEHTTLDKENVADNALHSDADAVETFKLFSADLGEACPNKLKLTENQRGIDKVLESTEQQGRAAQGPAVITRRVHPSVHRSNGVSFQDTSGFQDNKILSLTAGLSTSNIGGHTPFSIADTNQNKYVQISSPKKGSTFSGKQKENGESCPLSQTFHNKERENNFSKASFSDVVKNDHNKLNIHVPCSFDDSNVPGSFNNENSSLFRIDPKLMERRMDLCSFSVVGKVTLSKGDSPWLLKQLKVRIESFWGLKSAWRLISLGKGYYHILLNSKEDWDKVWSRGNLSLKPGILRLQRWSVDFDPLKEKNSNAQVWIRIYNLPWCLWEPSVLAGIARKVGVPIRIDRATLESDFGHFARVLVDIDLAKVFRSSLHVEYGCHVFEVQLVAENVPLFCQSCHTIGHSSMECRLANDTKAKSNWQKVEAIESTNTEDDFEINGGVKKQPLEVSVGKRMKPSVESHSRAQKTYSVKRRKARNTPEWKQKMVQDNGNVSDCNVGNSHHQHNALITSEMITDFGAQMVSNDSAEYRLNGFCSENQFSILSNLEGIDDERIDEETFLEEANPCTTPNLMAKVPEQAPAMVTQPDIPEGSNVKHSVFCDFTFPKIPEKWGDLLDEEDEFHRDTLPNPPRSIAEIRQGLYDLFTERPSRDMEFVERDNSLFQTDDAPSIMPLSIKKDKKVKIGFRHSKGSSRNS